MELAKLRERRGITGALALAGTRIGQQATAEKDERGGQENTFGGAILIDGVEETAVRTATNGLATRMKPELTDVFCLQHLLASV